jgi:hypothetical protein
VRFRIGRRRLSSAATIAIKAAGGLSLGSGPRRGAAHGDAAHALTQKRVRTLADDARQAADAARKAAESMRAATVERCAVAAEMCRTTDEYRAHSRPGPRG